MRGDGLNGHPCNVRRAATAILLLISIHAAAAPAARAAGLGVPSSIERTILTGVLQGVQAVRVPTSPQSFAYEFDPEINASVRGTRPGPAVLRSPATIAEGTWTARLAVSYLHLDQDYWPTTYEAPRSDGALYGRFGALFTADLTLIDLSAVYGLTDRMELSLDVPLSVVDVETRYRWLYDRDNPRKVSIRNSESALEEEIASKEISSATRGPSVVTQDLFGPQRYDDGANVGLGQISLGGKYALYRGDRVAVSPSFELLLPSPNEQDLAGPESVGMTTRLLSMAELGTMATAYLDVGYTYEIQFPELTGFVWNVGTSLAPSSWLSVDVGAGGTEFSKGATGMPQVLFGKDEEQQTENTFVATTKTGLGTTAVNFLFGVKLALTDGDALTGTAVVPVAGDTIQPAAAGTIGFEHVF